MTTTATGYTRGVSHDLSTATATASDAHSNDSDEGGDASDTARRGVWALARAGLAARGIVYLMVGGISAEIALDALLHRGGPSIAASTDGAVQSLATHLAGRVMLIVLAVGLAGYVVFSAIDTVTHHNDEHPAVKRWGDRALSVFGAGLYGYFCYEVVSAILAPSPAQGSAASSDAHDRAITAKVMALPGGRELVGLVGLVLVISFFFLARRAIKRTFAERYNREEISERWWRAAMILGAVGYLLRGYAFGVVGVFILMAAIRFDPSKAVGLDGSLRQLAHDPWGPWVMFPVAFGLIIYGVYLGIETRFREI